VFARSEGMAELGAPKILHMIDALPVLAIGKTDYVALEKLFRG
jgi:non-ribosomal peptide synthetase component E (peptide arylation enzyme)